MRTRSSFHRVTMPARWRCPLSSQTTEPLPVEPMNRCRRRVRQRWSKRDRWLSGDQAGAWLASCAVSRWRTCPIWSHEPKFLYRWRAIASRTRSSGRRATRTGRGPAAPSVIRVRPGAIGVHRVDVVGRARTRCCCPSRRPRRVRVVCIRRGEPPRSGAVGVHDVDVEESGLRAGRTRSSSRPATRQGRSGGTEPAGDGCVGLGVGQPLLAPTVRIHHVDRVVAVTRAHERDVGRPRRRHHPP